MPDPGRSILFREQQNPELATEAREMSLAFADSSYLRWVSGEKDPHRAWEMYFDSTQRQVRGLLDGLLGSFPPEERGRALELAGLVEAFCLPSDAVESRVFENPGSATGFLIGISPLTIQLSAEIAWGMSTAHPYLPEALPPGWDAATMHAQESLALVLSRYVRAMEGNGEAPVPMSMVVMAMERSRVTNGGPRDYYDAALTFALTHELAHISNGDLLPAQNRQAAALIPEHLASLLQISAEENEELAADASTFTACFNYLLTVRTLADKHHDDALSPRERLNRQAQLTLNAWHSACRATEACEAYYTAVTILSDIAFRRGDDDAASRLLTTGMRLPYVQHYVQQMREEVLADSYGPFMWTDQDVMYRKANHSWRVYFVENFLPAVSRHQRPESPDWITDWKTPADLVREPQFLAAVAAQREQQVADLARELGPDHPQTLVARANVAYMRVQAGDTAGAIATLVNLIPDMERVWGADDPNIFPVLHNLAWLRGEAGDAAEASAAFTKLLAAQKRALGPDHPETLDTRYELAHLRGNTGDVAGAVADFVQLRADLERVLGPDHAATLATRESLAHWQERLGDTACAAAAHAALHADKTPILSPDHPGTRVAYEARLEDHERRLGRGHPDTLTTLWFLAVLRGKAGDAAGAVAAYAELLNHDLGPLGFDEVDIRLIRENVAHWRRIANGRQNDVG
ncbi:tetratricopeptide repeat protein [Streptomyces sp. NPDC087317]|uniref:tetratricopeptide repeat protein n=1 Tax=Streptomyces sp. NPDC087317 TaxID=3365784 RepID=UPI00381CF18D